MLGTLLLRWFGVFYVAVGALDFFMHDARGYEFGVLNVNAPHSAIHILTGLVFVAASLVPRLVRPVTWLYIVLFAILVIEGIRPQINPLQWWVPLDGAVLWYHVFTLAVLVAVLLTTPKAAALRPVENAR